jgi:hypothetical protein
VLDRARGGRRERGRRWRREWGRVSVSGGARAGASGRRCIGAGSCEKGVGGVFECKWHEKEAQEKAPKHRPASRGGYLSEPYETEAFWELIGSLSLSLSIYISISLSLHMYMKVREGGEGEGCASGSENRSG